MLKGFSSCCKHSKPLSVPWRREQRCHSPLTVTQGLAVTPRGPAAHSEHQVSLAQAATSAVDAAQKAKITGEEPTGGLAHPTPPSPPQLICQLQVGVRQAASSSGAWDSASRPSLEQHVGHRAWERPGPRQEGLEILQKQDLEHILRRRCTTPGRLNAACGHGNKSGGAGCRRERGWWESWTPLHKAQQERGAKGSDQGRTTGSSACGAPRGQRWMENMSERMMSLHSWDTVPPSGQGWAETSMEQMALERPGWCHEQGSGLGSSGK